MVSDCSCMLLKSIINAFQPVVNMCLHERNMSKCECCCICMRFTGIYNFGQFPLFVRSKTPVVSQPDFPKKNRPTTTKADSNDLKQILPNSNKVCKDCLDAIKNR